MAFVAWLALISGVGIVGLWTMLIATGQVPEIEERDRAIWFHITAEYLLGFALISSGLLLLLIGADVSIRVFAGAALGGTAYSTINSSGYYARKDQWVAVGAFGALTVFVVVALAILILGG
ncbi:MAG: hypothetical protein ABFR53_06510 [Actinomycetota bacterium]